METTNLNPVTQTGSINVSERYAHVQTSELIDIIAKEYNLKPVKIRTNHTAIKTRGFQKHAIAFGREDLKLDVDQLLLWITNSHNGLTSIQTDLGIWRLICDNGAMSGNAAHTWKTSHRGNVTERVLGNIQLALGQMDSLKENVTRFKQATPEFDKVVSFAKGVIDLRIQGDEKTKVWTYANPLKIRRNGDAQNDAWTIFNRGQETVLRGGMRYLVERDGVCKANTTRAISAPAEVSRLNKAVWNLAESTLLA
jgi:hypothetical protein